MIPNFFKITLRVLFRQSQFSLINIIGLAIGLSSFILTSLWVYDEWTFDKFHEDIDCVYYVAQDQYYAGEPFSVVNTPYALKKHLVDNYPEVEKAFRITYSQNLNFTVNNEASNEEVIFSDPEIFDVLTFNFQSGSAKDFNDKYSVVISDAFKQRHFANESAIGKIISSNQHSFEIVGVLKPIPKNTTIRPNVVMNLKYLSERGVDIDAWGGNSPRTIIKLADETAVEEFAVKIIDVLKEPQRTTADVFLHPYVDLHLYRLHYPANSPARMVWLFGLVALFTIFIACVNFTNLSTARSLKRSKEIGIRKALGSSKWQITLQFLSEAIFMSFVSVIVAVMLSQLILPFFNEVTQKELEMPYHQFGFILFLLVTSICSGVTAGVYPAFFANRFNPIRALRSLGQKKAGQGLRKILVVFQFAISVALILGTLVVWKQLMYLQTKDLGFEKEEVLYMPIAGIDNQERNQKIRRLSAELNGQTGITAVTSASHLPIRVYSNGGILQWEGKDPDFNPLYSYFGVGSSFIETFKMELLEGESFRGSPSDSIGLNIMVNKKFADVISPDGTAIGKTLRFPKSPDEPPAKIIGVVKDFDFVHLSQASGLLYIYYSASTPYLFVRCEKGRYKEVIAQVQEICARLFPDELMEVEFLDERIKSYYAREDRMAKLFNLFVAIAIIISSLGIFGLSAYSAQQRKKEIGIRKALGASIKNLVFLLNKEYLILVAVGNLIAIPFAAWYMNDWLDSFANHISMSWGLIVIAIGISLIISFVVVSLESLKSARQNPAETLSVTE